MNKRMLMFLVLLMSVGASLTLAGTAAGKAPAKDSAAPPSDSSFALVRESPAPPSMNPVWECDSAYQKGDCNRNGKLTLEDVTRLLNAVYLNSEGAYCPPCVADMNCDRLLTGLDAVWFVRYFFAFGRAPLNCP